MSEEVKQKEYKLSDQVIAQILNAYRENTSLLGYRIQPKTNNFDSRNIVV